MPLGYMLKKVIPICIEIESFTNYRAKKLEDNFF